MSGKEMFRIEPSYLQGVVMNGIKKKKQNCPCWKLKMEIQFPQKWALHCVTGDNGNRSQEVIVYFKNVVKHLSPISWLCYAALGTSWNSTCALTSPTPPPYTTSPPGTQSFLAVAIYICSYSNLILSHPQNNQHEQNEADGTSPSLAYGQICITHSVF